MYFIHGPPVFSILGQAELTNMRASAASSRAGSAASSARGGGRADADYTPADYGDEGAGRSGAGAHCDVV